MYKFGSYFLKYDFFKTSEEGVTKISRLKKDSGDNAKDFLEASSSACFASYFNNFDRNPLGPLFVGFPTGYFIEDVVTELNGYFENILITIPWKTTFYSGEISTAYGSRNSYFFEKTNSSKNEFCFPWIDIKCRSQYEEAPRACIKLLIGLYLRLYSLGESYISNSGKENPAEYKNTEDSWFKLTIKANNSGGSGHNFCDSGIFTPDEKGLNILKLLDDIDLMNKIEIFKSKTNSYSISNTAMWREIVKKGVK